MSEPQEEAQDEGQVLPLEEADGRAYATIRLVEVQRSMGTQDLGWHPELQAGVKCPQCQKHRLKRWKSTVYCGFCKLRWWSRRPQ